GSSRHGGLQRGLFSPPSKWFGRPKGRTFWGAVTSRIQTPRRGTPPGSRTGSPRPTRLPGPVFGSVIEGEYEWAMDKPARMLRAGDTFYEPTGCLHRVSKSPGGKTRRRVLAVVTKSRAASTGLTVHGLGRCGRRAEHRDTNSTPCLRPTPARL